MFFFFFALLQSVEQHWSLLSGQGFQAGCFISLTCFWRRFQNIGVAGADLFLSPLPCSASHRCHRTHGVAQRHKREKQQMRVVSFPPRSPLCTAVPITSESISTTGKENHGTCSPINEQNQSGVRTRIQLTGWPAVQKEEEEAEAIQEGEGETHGRQDHRRKGALSPCQLWAWQFFH